MEPELQDFGIMTVEWDNKTPTYNLRDLFSYCEAKKKSVEDLTDSEREKFRTN